MLFDRSKGVMYELNETASAVVDLLTSGTGTTDELVSALVEQFEADPEDIRLDLLGMIEDFTTSGLIVVRAATESSVSAP